MTLTRANLPPWPASRQATRYRIRVYERDANVPGAPWRSLGYLPGVFDTMPEAQNALYDVAGEHARANRGYRIVEVHAA
jgi:hypothetical protein